MSQKRSIFEEVSSDQRTPNKPKPGLIDQGRGGGRGPVRIWLIVLFALVAVMIMVGGLTRLTDSGLSITEWNVITGMIPPLSDAVWQSEFTKYQAICEFTEQNSGMSMAEFKTIYWWEWGHRQLGRVIGLVWIAGFAFFWLTKRIPAAWVARHVSVGALIGIQGAIGWWMVSSGVNECRTDVSSVRLAVHLGLAFVILGLITWHILSLSRREADLMQARRAREGRLYGLATGLMHFALLQVLLGALVAGIDAGRGYTDWPLMAGQFFPPDAFDLTPVWRNFVEDDGLVQFMHRMSGYFLFLFGLFVWRRSRNSSHAVTRRAFDWVAVILFGQIVLGIGTVMYSAPLSLAILHQIGAIALWVLILRARHLTQYPIAQSIRGAAA